MDKAAVPDFFENSFIGSAAWASDQVADSLAIASAIQRLSVEPSTAYETQGLFTEAVRDQCGGVSETGTAPWTRGGVMSLRCLGPGLFHDICRITGSAGEASSP
jgi:hypothetical protein